VKRHFCAFLSILAVFLLCSCAKQSEEPSKKIADLSAFAQELMATGAFSEELSLVDAEIGCDLYGLEPDAASEMLFYMSSGATAEELVLFRCAPETMNDILKVCQNRNELQQSLYASYKPEEVPKLENNISMTCDDALMFCVPADSQKVTDFLDGYFK